MKDKHLQCLEEIKKKLNSSKARSHLAWPSSTSNGEARTDEMTENIVYAIENGVTDHDSVKGFIGHSLFLDLENFSFTNDIPAEYMH